MSTGTSHRTRRQGYYIFLRDEKIKVDATVFAKKSSYFAEQSAQNPEGFEVKENVLRDSFLTFLSYCQDKKYEINTDNAQDLITLSRNWEVKPLEEEVTAFCQKRKIVVRPRIDPLGVLIDAIDNQRESVKELTDVARIINTLYDDDRIADVEPELLYRIVLIAEKEFEIDANKFKKFVLKLYKTNPETAVILSLKINFNDLTDEEFDMIAACPEIRTQSINFFVANTLSTIRNRVKSSINDLQMKNCNLLYNLNSTIRYREEMFLYELEQYKIQKKALIDQRLEQQKAEIQDIFEQLTSCAAHLDAGFLSENGLIDPRLLQNMSFAQKSFNQIHQSVQDALENGKQARHEDLRSGVQQRLRVWEARQGDADAQQKLLSDAFDETAAKLREVNEQMQEIDENLVTIKSTINAKIARDKVRADKVRRDTADIYSIFDEAERENIIKADKAIQDLEHKIEENCPIRKH